MAAAASALAHDEANFSRVGGLINSSIFSFEGTTRFSVPSAGRCSTAKTEQNQSALTPVDVEMHLARLSFREKVHALFDAQGVLEELYADKYRTASLFLFSTTLVLILLSVIVFVIESMPAYYGKGSPAFFILETICIAWFTFELGVRFATTQDRKAFCKDFLNFIDFASVVPYYIDLVVAAATGGSGAGNGFVVLRVIRLTRTFRVFKLSKYNDDIQVVGLALKASTDALMLLMFLVVITVVLFGSAIFFAEQQAAFFDHQKREWVRKGNYGGPDSHHPFQSIPHAFWWCLVTVTTVGYGDMYPVTFPGYLVASGAMVTGLLIVAFPIIILGTKFQEAREAHYRRKEMQLQEKMQILGLQEEEEDNTEADMQRSMSWTRSRDVHTMLLRKIDHLEFCLNEMKECLGHGAPPVPTALSPRLVNPLSPGRFRKTQQRVPPLRPLNSDLRKKFRPPVEGVAQEVTSNVDECPSPTSSSPHS